MNELKSTEIVVEDLQTQLKLNVQSYTQEHLTGEIADLNIQHMIYRGPMEQNITLSEESITIFLFLHGEGTLHFNSILKKLTPESIAIPLTNKHEINFEIPDDKELSFLSFTKTLSPQDIEDQKQFPTENKFDLFFKRFEDCEPYTEKIKSPNTISRTVLAADIVPRVSLGTVEAEGPDEVGAHKHPMLEQLFLGLSENDITVHADHKHTAFKQYSLLHIPLGSTHWVTVDEHKKMNYMWMDFFLTREGQVWLKTHKSIKKDKIDS